ncbi:hypothetical protein G7Y89_g3795 [Cudoniella acicularis]|uniref:Uncharacterized protein n=1 Tax=Cudoniella acicularis TaxID=354080 RepID=A0A8H4RSK2_9HELO|nr:hypothetical protein G7Y89_g3795 [Cudoniella acicularis]
MPATSTEGPGIDTQLAAWCIEMEVASTISNPVARLGFENALKTALVQIEDGLKQKQPCGIQNRRKEKQFELTPEGQSRTITTHSFTIACPLGKIYLYSTTTQMVPSAIFEEPRTATTPVSETKTILILHPARWLQLLGIKFGIRGFISYTNQSLGCNMSTYCAVPDEAAIFSLCKVGDISAVRNLLDQRLASPWDTNSRGLTPLFFAAQSGNVDLCRLMISCGANIEAKIFQNDSVATYACLRNPASEILNSCQNHISTLRLFIEYLEIEDHINCSGLLGLRRLFNKRCSHVNCSHAPDYPAVFYWAFPILRPEMSSEIFSVEHAMAQLFRSATRKGDLDALSYIIPLIGDLNSEVMARVVAPAHYLATNARYAFVRESARILILKGIDLHLL